MKLLGLTFGSVGDAELRRLEASAPAYDHVGSTLGHVEYSGVRHEERRVLGEGNAAFDAARSALRAWRPQRSLGATVTPPDVAPDLGETVVLGLGVGRARLVVPNRIVATLDEPGRYAYAYGTLPGHPERGEEVFLVEQDEAGVVSLTIRIHAVPSPALRPVGFVVRPLQRAALHRYLAAVAAHVEREGAGGAR